MEAKGEAAVAIPIAMTRVYLSQAMEKIDFVGSEIRRVGAEDFEDFVSGGHVNF